MCVSFHFARIGVLTSRQPVRFACIRPAAASCLTQCALNNGKSVKFNAESNSIRHNTAARISVCRACTVEAPVVPCTGIPVCEPVILTCLPVFRKNGDCFWCWYGELNWQQDVLKLKDVGGRFCIYLKASTRRNEEHTHTRSGCESDFLTIVSPGSTVRRSGCFFGESFSEQKRFD